MSGDPPSYQYDASYRQSLPAGARYGDDDVEMRPDAPVRILDTGPSEADKAFELKERMHKLLVEVCGLMDEGMREGLMIRWANIGMNPYGHHEAVDLHVMKRF